MTASEEQIKLADNYLSRLDKIASDIQSNHASWGMPFDRARDLVNKIDKLADDLEVRFNGEQSFQVRQVEILKQAKVIQSDGDEDYLGTFNAPMRPIQTDADELYMSAYADDQSSAVRDVA